MLYEQVIKENKALFDENQALKTLLWDFYTMGYIVLSEKMREICRQEGQK